MSHKSRFDKPRVTIGRKAKRLSLQEKATGAELSLARLKAGTPVFPSRKPKLAPLPGKVLERIRKRKVKKP